MDAGRTVSVGRAVAIASHGGAESPASSRISQVGRGRAGSLCPVRSWGRVGVQLGLALEEQYVPCPQAHGHCLHARGGWASSACRCEERLD